MTSGKVDWAEVGQRLRCIRKENGSSQREFGQQFGVSQNMISLYEKGRSRASMEFYIQAAQLGGKTIEWLLTGRQDPTLETLREMRDLHENMKSQLAIVRQLLDREAEAVLERTILSVDDPDRLRDILLVEKDLPACLREALADPGAWRALGMTGREVSTFLNLVRGFGEISADGLRLFLRLVRQTIRPMEAGKPRAPLARGVARKQEAPALPDDPS